MVKLKAEIANALATYKRSTHKSNEKTAPYLWNDEKLLQGTDVAKLQSTKKGIKK